MKGRLCRLIVCAAVILLTFVVSVAQAVPDERPKLKDFGSNLKRLKWDSKRERPLSKSRVRAKAVEALRDDVVQVGTNLLFPERL
jgi:hypothetical protein